MTANTRKAPGQPATGMQYTFLLTMQKADGSDAKNELVSVVARDHAEAWGAIGREVQRFMRSPAARFVTNVQLEQP